MKCLFYVDFWKKMFIFYLFFVDVHNWHRAPIQDTHYTTLQYLDVQTLQRLLRESFDRCWGDRPMRDFNAKFIYTVHSKSVIADEGNAS